MGLTWRGFIIICCEKLFLFSHENVITSRVLMLPPIVCVSILELYGMQPNICKIRKFYVCKYCIAPIKMTCHTTLLPLFTMNLFILIFLFFLAKFCSLSIMYTWLLLEPYLYTLNTEQYNIHLFKVFKITLSSHIYF